MNRVHPTGEEQPRPRRSEAPPSLSRDPANLDALLREARRLLACRSYDAAVARLEIHRPAEWASIDGSGARLLRLLSQAHLGRGDFASARDCLEHLRALELEKANLGRDELAAALSDLCKCYRGLNLPELEADCLAEARRIQFGG